MPAAWWNTRSGRNPLRSFWPPSRIPNPPAASAGLLENTDPQQLAMFLKNEHPQTIAVVLSNLSAEVAGGLLKSFPEETQAQVALRMASLDRVSPEVFQKVTEAIGSKLRSIRQIGKTDGVRALAALLNHMDAEQAEALLAKVEEQNQPVADSVRSLMFVFEDILNIDKEGMRGAGGQARPQSAHLGPQGHRRQRCGNTSRSACRSAAPKCWPRIWRPWGPCEFAMSRRPKRK